MDLLSVGQNQIVTSLLPIYYNNSYSTLEDVIRTIILEKEIEKHPIGSLEFNTSGTNPNTYLGFGTWELWGKGKVPVGVDPNDTDYNAAELTGGNKTVNLSHYHSTGNFALGVEHIPNHGHHLEFWISGGGHNHNAYFLEARQTNSWNYSKDFARSADAGGDYNKQITTSDGSHSHYVNGDTWGAGGGQAHNHGNTGSSLGNTDIRQPYITCYMWKRTV